MKISKDTQWHSTHRVFVCQQISCDSMWLKGFRHLWDFRFPFSRIRLNWRVILFNPLDCCSAAAADLFFLRQLCIIRNNREGMNEGLDPLWSSEPRENWKILNRLFKSRTQFVFLLLFFHLKGGSFFTDDGNILIYKAYFCVWILSILTAGFNFCVPFLFFLHQERIQINV